MVAALNGTSIALSAASTRNGSGSDKEGDNEKECRYASEHC